jgi:hypothetical protein
MMQMQLKFFEGELPTIEEKFNQWSSDKYIAETSLHFKGKDRSFAVLQVVYGEKEQSKSTKNRRFC